MAQGLPSGTLLYHNQYRIEKVLGQGGFGITYLAKDIFLDREVAIKQFYPRDYVNMDKEDDETHLSSSMVYSSEFIQKIKTQFLNEAKHIARLEHPNIIKIFMIIRNNTQTVHSI